MYCLQHICCKFAAYMPQSKSYAEGTMQTYADRGIFSAYICSQLHIYAASCICMQLVAYICGQLHIYADSGIYMQLAAYMQIVAYRHLNQPIKFECLLIHIFWRDPGLVQTKEECSLLESAKNQVDLYSFKTKTLF